MGWKHQCNYPGNFRIWLRRARSGAAWSCKCGTWWELARRSLVPGHSHWEWRLMQDEPDHQHEPQGAFAETQLSYRDPSQYDGGYHERPEIQLGFQREAP